MMDFTVTLYRKKKITISAMGIGFSGSKAPPKYRGRKIERDIMITKFGKIEKIKCVIN